jgi:hypothetical protein
MELYGKFLEGWLHHEVHQALEQHLHLHHQEEPEPIPDINNTSADALKGLLHKYPTSEQVHKMIEGMLERYSADEIGKTDFALASAGGSIVAWRTSPSYVQPAGSFWSSVLSPQAAKGLPPTVLLSPDNSVGNCWAFNGPEGHVTIKLSHRIVVTAVSVDHISPLIAMHPESAPRYFKVWGLHNETDTAIVLLGNYEYDIKGPHVQTFPVQFNKGRIFQYVEVEIMANYGHQYTCVYRIRVHGNPAD